MRGGGEARRIHPSHRRYVRALSARWLACSRDDVLVLSTRPSRVCPLIRRSSQSKTIVSMYESERDGKHADRPCVCTRRPPRARTPVAGDLRDRAASPSARQPRGRQRARPPLCSGRIWLSHSSPHSRPSNSTSQLNQSTHHFPPPLRHLPVRSEPRSSSSPARRASPLQPRPPFLPPVAKLPSP